MLEKQIKGLEEIFDYFNKEKFDSSFEDRPVITIQSAGRKSALGWCTVLPVWSDSKSNRYYEINVSAEHLGSGLLSVAETMLHEMVHLSNLQNGIKDCSPKTQYHNKSFKSLAEAVGLVVEKSKKYGYGHTSLSEELKEELKEVTIEDVFDLRRGLPMQQDDGDDNANQDDNADDGEEKPVKKRVFHYICECCGAEVKSKIEGLNISCKNCDLTFTSIEK